MRPAMRAAQIQVLTTRFTKCPWERYFSHNLPSTSTTELPLTGERRLTADEPSEGYQCIAWGCEQMIPPGGDLTSLDITPVRKASANSTTPASPAATACTSTTATTTIAAFPAAWSACSSSNSSSNTSISGGSWCSSCPSHNLSPRSSGSGTSSGGHGGSSCSSRHTSASTSISPCTRCTGSMDPFPTVAVRSVAVAVVAAPARRRAQQLPYPSWTLHGATSARSYVVRQLNTAAGGDGAAAAEAGGPRVATEQHSTKRSRDNGTRQRRTRTRSGRKEAEEEFCPSPADSTIGGGSGGGGADRRRKQSLDEGRGDVPDEPSPGPGPGSSSAAAAAAATAASLTDLTRPASWYPLARSLQRKVVAHLGPTNSGKTHAALQALKSASSGIYCGPLRLLACEVADRLTAEGLPCHLVTGQEVRPATGPAGEPKQASHTACTIEMAEVNLGALNRTTAAAAAAAATERGSGSSGGDDGAHGGCARGAPGGGGAASWALDVAVLDEIQMLGDRLRGWAWTRALLGLAAREVHVAGDPAVLPLLRALAAECGDELEVRRYRRLSPLVVQSEALGSVARVAGGDCLVAFSRRSLHGLRREVARCTGREACLVYGALPPEARRQQAALFNAVPSPHPSAAASASAASAGDYAAPSGPGTRVRRARPCQGHQGHQGHQQGEGSSQGDGGHQEREEEEEEEKEEEDPAAESGGDGQGCAAPGSHEGDSESGSWPAAGSRVLCASDAIGMGLNLNIRRVVFTSLTKYDGTAVRPLQPAEVRQIAGRAGRFSSSHPAGYVTTLRSEDLGALHRALAQPPEHITHACLLPSSEALAEYAALHPERPLATSLLTFAATARLGPSYMYGNYEGMYGIASALRELSEDMSYEEMMLFCTAPADMDDPVVASALLRFAQLYCRRGRVGPEDITEGREQPLLLRATPVSEAELKRLEELHRVYDLYVWLFYRLPYAFTGREEAESARAACGSLIEAGLDHLAAASAAAFGRRNHNHHHDQPQ